LFCGHAGVIRSQWQAIANDGPADFLALADLTPLAMPCMIPRMGVFVGLEE
jgi:hypothetical protein